MLKSVFAATAAFTIASSSIAYAQRDERSDGARRWHPTTEDMRAFQAARLAALRAGLTLTPEQEKHWPAFEQAMRDLQQFRLDRITKMRDARREGLPQGTDPAERMRERATRLAESGAVLKRLAEATDPLYRSLDEAQKRRFAILARTEEPRGWQRRGRDGGERGMPRGHHRTDVTPTDGVQTFTRKTVDGDVFAQAFVSKTVEGVFVGRVFGTKTVNGDLVVGEAAMLSGKTLEPIAFSGKFTSAGPAEFGPKPAAGEGAPFGRKIKIDESVTFGRKVVTSI
ncbi:MAG: Spy/CpxP family protein refolding chaperone [Xanthobacteraceae bacterium]|nr:Spy/CpxP family protein refolding chaperone [Xanthobacteraceae bacterium]